MQVDNYHGYAIETDCYHNEMGWCVRNLITNLKTQERQAIAESTKGFHSQEEAEQAAITLAKQRILVRLVGF